MVGKNVPSKAGACVSVGAKAAPSCADGARVVAEKVAFVAAAMARAEKMRVLRAKPMAPDAWPGRAMAATGAAATVMVLVIVRPTASLNVKGAPATN
jgi:hypothetical protein